MLTAFSALVQHKMKASKMSEQSQQDEEETSLSETSDEERQSELCHTVCETLRADHLRLESKMDACFGQLISKVDKIRAAAKADSRKKNSRMDHEVEAQRFKAELASAVNTIRSQSTELDELQEQLDTSQGEIEKLKQEKAKLRSMILVNSGFEKVSDDDIKRLFSNIRQQIQAITHSKVFDLCRSPNLPREIEAHLHEFYMDWNVHGTADSSFLLRGRIFQMVFDLVLAKDLFGITPIPHSGFGRIENSLQILEHFLIQEQVSTDAITDWRLATMRVVDLSKFSHDYSVGAYPEIISLLLPVVRDQQPPATMEKLHEDIYRMCQNAYQLRLLMRKSRDHYLYEGFVAGTIVHRDESRLEVHGVEHGGIESNIIAYTISPALMKCSGARGENLIVLEPAHVVVRSASDAA